MGFPEYMELYTYVILRKIQRFRLKWCSMVIILMIFAYGILMLAFNHESDEYSKYGDNVTSYVHINIIDQHKTLNKREMEKVISKSISKNDSVENYIESLRRRVLKPKDPSFHKKLKQNIIRPEKVTTVNYNNTVLLQKLDTHWHWQFIKMRTESNWDALVHATKYAIDQDLIPQKSTKRRVLVAPGVLRLTIFTKLFSEGKVAPLGELVQWSDLIAGLHILGHDVELHYDMKSADRILIKQLVNHSSIAVASNRGCGTIVNDFDLIYTDLLGHTALSSLVRNSYKHKFRILDTFGTEQAYNNVKYTVKKGTFRNSNAWGNRNLHLKQFYNMLPLTPDNTFLGCMIFNSTATNSVNKSIVYLYGKEPHLLKGRDEPSQIVPILQKYTEVHSSFADMPIELKPYKLVNHGQLNPQQYTELTQKTKVIIGLGRPEEGPGFLEAIARGCIVINPARPPNWKFHGKPTNRTVGNA